MTNEATSADRASIIFDEIVPARAPWSGFLRKGQILRIVDLEGQQAVDALFYRADHFAERYSAQDTLRAQKSAYIGLGSKLISNEGNLMLTVVGDSCGLHDTSRRRLQLRKQHGALWPPHKIYARLPGEFCARDRQIRHGQARSRQQHQLLHECADRAVRRTRHRRRRLGAGRLCRSEGRDGCARASSPTARRSTTRATASTRRRSA